MMKKRTKALIAAITLCIMLPLTILPTSANSRAPYWEGTDSNGVIFKEGDVPIEVESELLTFDIPTLPYNEYRSGEYFLDYDSKVTAEYTFYNPTDMTVKATLLFPYGELPEYAHLTDKDGNDLREAELNKYDITVNGQPIEKTVRHTYNLILTDNFDVDRHIASLSDKYLEDEFYTPDLTVTAYTYVISGVNSSYLSSLNRNKSVQAQIIFHSDNDKLRFVDNDQNLHISNNSGEYTFNYNMQSETEAFTFYVIGDTLPDPTVTRICYRTSGMIDYKDTNHGITYTEETMTLEDLLLKNYDEKSGISRVDWYNAGISQLRQGVLSLNQTYTGYRGLVRWYEYEITIGPGERIVNTVTAPLYPNINNFAKPREYEYSYLLSPASGWANFGKLDIVINTEYEMGISSLEGFEKTDSGYRLTREGLPTDEEGKFLDLMFSLKTDGNTPLKQPNPSKFLGFLEGVWSVIRGIFVIIFVVILYIVEWISSWFR